MTKTSWDGVVQHVRRLANPQVNCRSTDAELLHAFITFRDEDAFAALVRRHGPLVQNVCRRVLHHTQDAEDAFQATFLVLARKAASVHRRAALASWLYGAARRMALSAKRSAARRRAYEGQVTAVRPNDPCADLAWREVQALLEEEIGRLPETYRAVFVLRCLESKSQAEVATLLGLKEGTVSSRLNGARKRLQNRLVRRGVALPTVLAAMALMSPVARAVPAAIVKATVRAAVAVTSGNGTAAGVISERVASLVEGGLRAMLAGKQVATCLLLTVGLLASAAATIACQATVGKPLPEKPAQPSGPRVGMPDDKEAAQRKDAFGDPLPEGAAARLGTVRFRHGAPVHFLALPPGGGIVISAADDRLVRVWDSATGKELRRMGPGGGIESGGISRQPLLYDGTRPAQTVAAVSKDGKLLASQFDEPDVTLWEVATGKKVGSIPLDKFELMSLAFAPSGKQLAMGSRGGIVRVWDIEAGKVMREFGQAPTTQIRMTSGNSSDVVYAPDGTILVSLVSEGAPTNQGDPHPVVHVRFFEPATGRELRSITVSEPVLVPPVFSPDGTLLAYAGGAGAEIGLIEVDTGVFVHKWRLNDALVNGWPALAFAANGAKLYSRVAGSGERIREWDVKTAKELRQLGDASDVMLDTRFGPSGSLALSADGKTLAFGGGDSSIHFVDVESGKEVRAAGGAVGKLRYVSYPPDGKSLLTVDRQALRWWDLATGKQVKQLAVQKPGAELCRFSADGRYLAAPDLKAGTAIYLREAASGKELAVIPISTPYGAMFRFAPNGRTLIVCGTQNETDAELYDVPSGKKRCAVPLGDKVRRGLNDADIRFFFSPDGRRIGVQDLTGAVAIRDAVTGKLLLTIPREDGDLPPPRTGLSGDVAGVIGGAFSPDGCMVALDHSDGRVRVIELASGKERGTYAKTDIPNAQLFIRTPFRDDPAGLLGDAATVAFSPDGRLLAHARFNSIHVWDAVTGRSLARFEGHQGPVNMIAFAPDGRSLASVSSDATALVWDVQGLDAKTVPAPRGLDANALAARWDELAGDDARAAVVALNALAGSPREAVAFLKTRLQPAAALKPAFIAKWVAELDSVDVRARQKAQTELRAAGEQALPYLEKELARDGLPLQMRQRLEALRSKLTVALPFTGERLRMVRAVEVLQHIGTAEARELLQALAGGAPGTLAASQSEAALERLNGKR